MKKPIRIIISILTIIIGWILNAFAFTTKMGHPTSTIALLVGLGLFFSGLTYLIITIKNKAHTHNTRYKKLPG